MEASEEGISPTIRFHASRGEEGHSLVVMNNGKINNEKVVGNKIT
jgi:hypothetical protein